MIEVAGLTKRYGDVTAVDDVTFTVRPGVVTGFLGPNGAGKTTTMRMLLGLARPTSGSASIGGRAYRDHPVPMRAVGALLDAGAVDGARRARDHLRWIARAAAITDERVDEVLGLVGLADVAGRRVDGFSLGMRQRLGLAAALLGDPPVLVLDEPANGLDAEGIRWVRELLRHLAAEGRTVLVSSHLMHEMEATADHVLVIGRGHLLADMSVDELTTGSAASHVHVVSPDIGRLAEMVASAGGRVEPADSPSAHRVVGLDNVTVGDLAAAAGLRIHELGVRRATLEATFMELTAAAADHVGADQATSAGREREEASS